ncbi:MAG: hypothetical protein ABSA51_03920 [Anaerolineaceae bacterium]|jgi:hypothetical protein
MISDNNQIHPLKRKTILFQVIFLLILCLVTLAVLIPANPSYYSLAGKDSGVFLYIGKQILQGQIPYRDVWDQKPPFVFYINALALWLSSGSRWGVFIIEALSLFSAFTLAFYFLRSLLGDYIAALTTLAGLLFAFWAPGNLTEEYYLPYGFLAFMLWLVIQKQGKGAKWWVFFLWGLTGGIAFQLKQNLIGVWLAFAAFYCLKMIFTKDLRYVKSLLWMLLGAITPEIIFIVYFAANHALEQYWSDSFIFNFIYSQNIHSTFFANILSTLQRVSTTGAIILPVGFFLWLLLWPRLFHLLGKHFASYFTKKKFGLAFLLVGVCGIFLLLFAFGRSANIETLFTLNKILISIFAIVCLLVGVLWVRGLLNKWFPQNVIHGEAIESRPLDELWIILLLDWVIEILLISVPGKSYGHYFDAILPVSTIIFAEFLGYMKNLMQGSEQRWFFWPLAFLLCIPIYYNGISQVVNILATKPIDRSSLAVYIDKNTTEHDTVLVWGDEVDYLILANRTSPEKFIYQFPLYYSQYVTDDMIKDFLNNLKSSPPKFVIDTGDSSAPFINYNNQGTCSYPKNWMLNNHETPVPAQLSPLFQFFCDNYKFVTSSQLGWPIYQYTPVP